MSFDDERVRFYLRHRARLEEWAGLRSEAVAAVHAWLVGLRPDVKRLASELGPDVLVQARVSDDTDWPSFLLFRSAWPVRSEGPAACVALEWGRRRVVLHDDDWPYVGLRSFKDDPIGIALRQSEPLRRIRTSARTSRARCGSGTDMSCPAASFRPPKASTGPRSCAPSVAHGTPTYPSSTKRFGRWLRETDEDMASPTDADPGEQRGFVAHEAVAPRACPRREPRVW